MPESTLIHWIEILAAALVALFAGAAAWVRHAQNAHLEDLREQLRREQEDKQPESQGPRSARAVPRKKQQ